MSEVTLKETDLPAGHPALGPDGHFTERARKLLNARFVPSRVHTDPQEAEDGDYIRNTELFYRIADEIEVFPEEYDQEVWGTNLETLVEAYTPCGSSFCIAGHAAHMTNWVPFMDGIKHFDFGRLRKARAENNLDNYFDASSVGAAELGLSPDEASVLFEERWQPDPELTVPQALRMLGDGVAVADVTDQDILPMLVDMQGLNPSRHSEIWEYRKSTGKLPVY